MQLTSKTPVDSAVRLELEAPNDAGLTSLGVRSLAPLLWRAERLGSPSAWWQHVPFAHWIVSTTAPRCLVELGTHAGVSYSAFCAAIAASSLGTRCYAVDTWHGDVQSGEYGDEVFEDFRRFHDDRYSTFSTLLRCTFDEALDKIADQSVDLLHIDGLHTYDAVHHDYASWLPKLSDRAVVLFHDINEHSGDFGVWRLWSELREQHPHFEFVHGHGLGLLAVGNEIPPAVRSLCGMRDLSAVNALRGLFARLGERWWYDTRERMVAVRLQEAIFAADSHARQLEAAKAQDEQRRREIHEREMELAASRMREEEARMREEEARAEIELLGAELATLRGRLADAISAEEAAEGRTRLAERDRERAVVRLTSSEAVDAHDAALASLAEARWLSTAQQLDAVLASTLWRVMDPLRAIGRRLPSSSRRLARGAAKVAWWTMTLSLPRKLRARRAAISLAQSPVAVSSVDAPTLQSVEHAPASGEDRVSQPLADLPEVVWISGEPATPGHIYRVLRPLAAVTALGVRATWMPLDEVPRRLPEIEAAKVTILWRTEWNDAVASAVGAARASGAKIIFDVDDLMVDPELARFDVIDGIRTLGLTEEGVRGHYGRIRLAMSNADLCLATTEELASHMRRAGMPTLVLPNSFDEDTRRVSRLAARRRSAASGHSDSLIRIGYAGGSRTHQRDFAICIDPVADILRAHPECRLVLFRSRAYDLPCLDVCEFRALDGLEDRIEWRDLVPLRELPGELARLDVNLAPLEVDNPFCEAKSELKFFEAALAGVPTVASPTGPYRRAIRHGETGLLASTADEWRDALTRLVQDADFRTRLAAAAELDVAWRFSPERISHDMSVILDLLPGGSVGAKAFEVLAQRRRDTLPAVPAVPAHEILFIRDSMRAADATVVVPLYNYVHTIIEALDSVHSQTLKSLDLIVVDDHSTDDSVTVTLNWAQAHAERFNRLLVARNRSNQGLGATRNVGFALADTPWVLPLDADNRLRPDCVEECLATVRGVGAAFAYPLIKCFGDEAIFSPVWHDGLMGKPDWDPVRISNGNYVDAMALISRAAWASAGGYDTARTGWEDFDLWCRLAERGFWGKRVPGEPLADYRAHGTSMIQSVGRQRDKVRWMMRRLESRHPWLTLVPPIPEANMAADPDPG